MSESDFREHYFDYKNNLSGAWRCPHCHCNARLRGKDIFQQQATINNYDDNQTYFTFIAIQCPNKDCEKLVAQLNLNHLSEQKSREEITYSRGLPKEPEIYKQWSLLPEYFAKPFPSYIPQAIRQDYEEACKIKELSPKASATLARRCLQGIIRDFFGVGKKDTLKKEIEAISDNAIDSDIKEALQSIRKIGNIGAHMEQDVNLIVDIDSNEASELIIFIENFLELTYIKRHKTQENLGNIRKIEKSKKSR